MGQAFTWVSKRVAAHIHCYSACVIPGLLQTRQYAEAACRAVRPSLTHDQARRLVGLQHRRREHLASGHRLHLIIDQAALIAPVAPADIMARQLNRLVTYAADPSISVQVTALTSTALSSADSTKLAHRRTRPEGPDWRLAM